MQSHDGRELLLIRDILIDIKPIYLIELGSHSRVAREIFCMSREIIESCLRAAVQQNFAPLEEYLSSPTVDVNLLNIVDIEFKCEHEKMRKTEFSYVGNRLCVTNGEHQRTLIRILNGHFEYFSAVRRFNALELVVYFQKINIVTKLIELGVDPKKTVNNMTVTELACSAGSEETLKILLRNGAPIFPELLVRVIRSFYGAETIGLCLESGVQIRGVCSAGLDSEMTPLVHAILISNVQAVTVILDELKRRNEFINEFTCKINRIDPETFDPEDEYEDTVLGCVLKIVDIDYTRTICEHLITPPTNEDLKKMKQLSPAFQIAELLMEAGVPLPLKPPSLPTWNTFSRHFLQKVALKRGRARIANEYCSLMTTLEKLPATQTEPKQDTEEATVTFLNAFKVWKMMPQEIRLKICEVIGNRYPLKM